MFAYPVYIFKCSYTSFIRLNLCFGLPTKNLSFPLYVKKPSISYDAVWNDDSSLMIQSCLGGIWFCSDISWSTSCPNRLYFGQVWIWCLLPLSFSVHCTYNSHYLFEHKPLQL
jgi:hypothetical protein